MGVWTANHLQELSNELLEGGGRRKGGDSILFFVKECLAAVFEAKGGGHHQDNLSLGELPICGGNNALKGQNWELWSLHRYLIFQGRGLVEVKVDMQCT